MVHLREFFGTLRADRLNETDFAEYAEHRKKPHDGKEGASNGSINRELEMAMKALRIGKIFPLPVFKKLPESAPRQGFFDDAMISKVVDALPEYLRPPFLFGYYTGWRREEVFGLEWTAVDFTAGEVRLWDSKNDRPRVFPIDAVAGLRDLLLAQQPREGDVTSTFVFARRLKKRKIARRITEFRKALTRACDAAGCPGMTFHDLRRSAARNLELAGWPRSLVMSWMGHETEAMFHRYRIVSAADREVVVQMLEKRKAVAGK
jgi:integrase